MKEKIKVGTRASPLAMAQTHLLVRALQDKHPHLKVEGAVDIISFTTTGDRIQDKALAAAGGKGLFTKELEDALQAREIDCAVHSMKDMPTVLPAGLEISCILPRDDVRDAFFSRTGAGLDDLPAGAVVGTASLRRQAQVLQRRPDLKVALLRGNVATRLRKLEDGVVDATLLAACGLHRLGQDSLLQHVLDKSVMLPAVGQGAIGVEIRSDDVLMRTLLDAAHCRVTELCVAAERAYLHVMDGSCRTPLAAQMETPDPDGRARLDVFGAVADLSVSARLTFMMQVTGLHDAVRLGEHAGHEMRKELARQAVA